MTYDQWKDPTEDTSEQERLEAEYEAEMLIECAAEMDGWEPDDEPLVKAGLVKGTLDADGYLDAHDSDAADKMLLAAVNDL